MCSRFVLIRTVEELNLSGKNIQQLRKTEQAKIFVKSIAIEGFV
jgi:hypothetical protein